MNWLQMYTNLSFLLLVMASAAWILMCASWSYTKSNRAARVVLICMTGTTSLALIFCTAMSGLLS